MSQKLSRRSFLKTAGAVAVAAAAMSTLTACGGGGSSTPAYSSEKAAMVTGINKARKDHGKNEVKETAVMDKYAEDIIDDYIKSKTTGDKTIFSKALNSIPGEYTIDGKKATYAGCQSITSYRIITDYSEFENIYDNEYTHVGISIKKDGDTYYVIILMANAQ